MSDMTREQFVERVVSHTRAKFPLVKIARGDDPFSLKINGNIAGLENLYRLTVLKPDDLEHNVDRWVVEMLRAAEGRPELAESFEAVKERIFPMVLVPSSDAARMQSLVVQPLIEGLVVAYALDEGQTISYIPRSQFEHWKITVDELHETALSNLVQRSEAISAHAAQDEEGNINLILFQTMDGYDASRILLPTLHDRLREHLGSPFAAAIPNRDILLCFRDDEETVTRLREQIDEDYRSMPHQVTNRLMLITADGLAPHE